MSIRAAIYARFSTEKQKDASIEDQFRECEDAAKSAGLEVVARFEDRGISAGTAERPGYQALLAAARRHEFDIIVTEDISRLWRNRAEFGPRSAELEDLGVHWLSCVGQDTRREGWGLVVQILQAMAEQARREASYRTRRGLHGKARSGGSTGGRAYGYVAARDSSTGQIEI
jgi:site-specific DNA recombinase